MLQIKNISKDYVVNGELTVHALKDVSLDFRTNDFVAILGPSGCGKTTLLNIIGGLDKYTSGDLIINGKSTKNFEDRDWDTYRNHSVGFVFQSYNLIPHQTVLQNVELALTLSGVDKSERKSRAKEALNKVGLGDQLKKRPNQLSGGQMQRVAIARAIVNNPDIILADEPTGALDSETSVQVMEILKEISKDRLVVMVTHNPDLAEQYATRTIRLLDGVLLSDSKPLTEQEIAAEQDKEKQLEAQSVKTTKKGKIKKEKKPSLSFASSFVLSLKNLLSKKARTILTSFAGSIGIMGIALIFAVSNGMTNYINLVQEETLSSYPMVLQQTHSDTSSFFNAFVDAADPSEPHAKDAVYEKLALYNLTNAVANITKTENNLGGYKQHLDEQLKNPESQLSQVLNGVHYSYDLGMNVYTEDDDGVVVSADTGAIIGDLMSGLYGVSADQLSAVGGSVATMMTEGSNMLTIWEEILPEIDGQPINHLIKQQYKLIYGYWPGEGSAGMDECYREVVIVVDKDNEIDDMTLYALGLKPKAEMQKVVDAVRDGKPLPKQEAGKWTYEEICSRTYKTIFNYEFYKQQGDIWYDYTAGDHGLETLYHDDEVGIQLKVVGIIRASDSASSAMLSGSICYTDQLTKYAISRANESEFIKAQQESPDFDLVENKYFQKNSFTFEQKKVILQDAISKMTVEQKIETYSNLTSIPTEEEISRLLASWNKTIAESGVGALRNNLSGMFAQANPAYVQYLDAMSDEALVRILPQLAPEIQFGMNKGFRHGMVTPEDKAATYPDKLDKMIEDATEDKDNEGIGLTEWFDETIEFSSVTHEDRLTGLGKADAGKPTSIGLFAKEFDDKDVIKADLAEFNKGKDVADQIKYTDYVGIIMSGVTTIIDAVTAVLIGFVSISLIVSSIMIGVITLISVQERTKEIGILRAVGASKANVSGMFNVETVIIGAMSGLIGVGVTYLLCIPLNLILQLLTGIASLQAQLPLAVAGILVVISMILTLVAGIIPSRSAAKKDPVVALRTE